MTIVYFILILGITIFIHELGHFLFAKKFGVYVYEFSLGMGPRIFKFNRKHDETDYCIRLFPIGGFVQMAGEEVEVDENVPNKKRLQSKPIYQRCIIMIAGVMMNFLLAFVLLFCIGLFNTVTLDNTHISDSSISGLADGDKIISINDSFVNNYDKLALELTLVSSKKFDMEVKKADGSTKKLTITPVSIGNSNLVYGYDYGITVNDLIIVDSTKEGLSKDDKITQINGKDVTSYSELVNVLNTIGDKEFTLTVNNLKEENTVLITPKENKEDTLLGYNYGFYLKGTTGKGFLTAIKYAFVKFFSTIEQMIFTVFYLITGKLSMKLLSGPVGIFNAVSVYSQYGFSSLISLLCLICINVGFINILPLPAFDGGHVVFLIIEKIRGKKIDPKVENTIHNIGFALLMLLMIVITYNDIIRLF